MLLDDPGRVRSQILSVVCQIQRFDFACILVVSRKVIIRIPPVLGLKPLYRQLYRHCPDLIFIGQCEATLVWDPETGADCNFEIPDQIVGL